MKIIQGDALIKLKSLEEKSIDCVITSPPYWALRDYGIDGQIGRENSFEEYVENLCKIFDEVKRVLKPMGTVWVNLGDTYGTQSGAMRDGKFGPKNTNNQTFTQPKSIHKCLLQIPSRFAIAMIDRGWILRNEIVWHKPNAMPSSVKYRFSVDYEVIYFFVQQKKYYFEQRLEPFVSNNDVEYRRALRRTSDYTVKKPYKNNFPKSFNDAGRNKRSVWTIATKPFRGSHFSTFPEKLVETPIKAGCPVGGTVLDPFAGAGTTLIVAERLGRKAMGIEINPEYIKIAENRNPASIFI